MEFPPTSLSICCSLEMEIDDCSNSDVINERGMRYDEGKEKQHQLSSNIKSESTSAQIGRL